MRMLVVDLLFVLLFSVAYPVWGFRRFPRIMRAIVEGRPGTRRSAYRETIGWQWAMALAGIVLWRSNGWTLEELGLGVPGGRGFVAAAVLLVAAAVALGLQLRVEERSEEARRQVRAQLRGELVFLPRAAEDARTFSALSVTAGFCEEVLYRGWLLGFLARFLGIVPAVVLSTAAFGLGHLYLGRAGIVKPTLLGLLFALLTLLSGSLWVAIVLHALLDLNAGALSERAFRGDPQDEPA